MSAIPIAPPRLQITNLESIDQALAQFDQHLEDCRRYLASSLYARMAVDGLDPDQIEDLLAESDLSDERSREDFRRSLLDALQAVRVTP